VPLPRLSRRAKVILVVILVLAASVTSGISLWRSAVQCMEDREASSVHDQALRELPEKPTYMEVRRWLKAEGFTPLVWNPNDEEKQGWLGASYDGNRVIGYVIVGQRQFPGKDAWIDLQFHFDLNEELTDIRASTRYFPIASRR
jgi:hypothetical protein